MMTQFFQVLKHLGNQVNKSVWFYDDSILSGTKTEEVKLPRVSTFYDDSILSGTKTLASDIMLTPPFYDDSILSGTKTSNTTFYIKVKHMYLSFA